MSASSAPASRSRATSGSSSSTSTSSRRGATSSRRARAPRADARTVGGAAGTATLAAVLRPMLAGMLSVVLVAGLIALGAFLARDEPAEPGVAAGTGRGGATYSATPTAAADSDLPSVKLRTLPAAAKAAGCTVQDPPDQGAVHEQREFTEADYNSNPPTSGAHFPTPADDGVYASRATPELGRLVHSLEHGRIEIQYKRGTPTETVRRLHELYDALDGGYHLLLFENATTMPYAVAATAWGHLLGCPKMNDHVFDALRAFRKDYVDKGPEIVP